MSLTTITVTGSYPAGAGGRLATGFVTFAPTARVVNATGHAIIPQLPIQVPLQLGAFSLPDVVCTDNAGLLPSGWAWQVTEYIDGVPADPYTVDIPSSYGASVDLAQLSPVTPAPTSASFVQLGGQIGGTSTTPEVLAVGITPSGDTTGTADTATIQAEINAASGAGGGTVYLAAGTFTTRLLTLPANVALQGAGSAATAVQLAAAQNTDLIQTAGFSSLTGTDTAATPYGVQVRGLTLDGNKSGQSAGSGNCLAFYAYGCVFEDLVCRNARGVGFWSEWGSASAFLGPNGMESFVAHLKCHDNDGGAMTFIGPHDSQVSDAILVQNSGYESGRVAFSVPTDGRANGSIFRGVHVYGGAYDYGVLAASAGVTFEGCQLEGAQVAQAKVDASQVNFADCRWFWGSSGSNTAKGVVLGDGGHAGLNGLRLTGKIENCSGGAIDLTYATGGSGHYDLLATYVSPYTVPSPAVIGTLAASDYAAITVTNNSGQATGDSVLQMPGAANVGTLTIAGVTIPSVVDQDPLALGFATTHPWAAEANGTQGVYQAGYAYYMRLVGYGMTVSALRIYVGAQSGNICVGVYGSQGSGSSAAPYNLKATTGSIPCPAPGEQAVALTSSVTIARGDWVAIAVDNTGASFLRSAPTTAVTNGAAANQASAFPLPGTADAANGSGTCFWIASP